MCKSDFYTLIEQVRRDRLFGEISFSFRNGVLTFVTTTKTEPAEQAVRESDVRNR